MTDREFVALVLFCLFIVVAIAHEFVQLVRLI
jgi:hypothetical protein